MQTLTLQTQNLKDLLIFIQLAERLGVSYTQNEVQIPQITRSFHKIAKPLRKKMDIEELKREQNYKGANKVKMQKIVAELAIEEPLELLLSQLTP